MDGGGGGAEPRGEALETGTGVEQLELQGKETGLTKS